MLTCGLVVGVCFQSLVSSFGAVRGQLRFFGVGVVVMAICGNFHLICHVVVMGFI